MNLLPNTGILLYSIWLGLTFDCSYNTGVLELESYTEKYLTASLLVFLSGLLLILTTIAS